MTFEEARAALEHNARRYNAGRITIDEWCAHVQYVLACFESSRGQRSPDFADGAAPAMPRVADPAQTSAAEARVVITDGHPVYGHSTAGHSA